MSSFDGWKSYEEVHNRGNRIIGQHHAVILRLSYGYQLPSSARKSASPPGNGQLGAIVK